MVDRPMTSSSTVRVNPSAALPWLLIVFIRCRIAASAPNQPLIPGSVLTQFSTSTVDGQFRYAVADINSPSTVVLAFEPELAFHQAFFHATSLEVI